MFSDFLLGNNLKIQFLRKFLRKILKIIANVCLIIQLLLKKFEDISQH